MRAPDAAALTTFVLIVVLWMQAVADTSPGWPWPAILLVGLASGFIPAAVAVVIWLLVTEPSDGR